ncbi:unnamed protein product [Pieris macdunnoughi]|uniref:Codanin-1 C-terminal domain-containing protein n=1 Tax=Pieris macdunnoughi TaxID=345717 RepID=A0A821UCU6_9NEOP|nr:unnamed protein product [Pieris macdunnoughi]
MTEVIESVLTGKLNCDLLIQWLNNESIEGAPDDCILFCCSRNEFVAYFLSFLRNQTDGILQTNNSIQLLNQTPEKLSKRKHHRSISDPGNENEKIEKSDRKIQESPNRERKKTGRRVKTKLFTEEKSNQSISSDESRLSVGIERITISTPLKNGTQPDFMASPVTPTSKSFSERCDTPRMSRHSRSQDKSISLGDYLVSAQPKSAKKKRASKNASSEDLEPKVDLDLSNSDMFPEIGARKANSLRSERRRIKPTVIDKSVSLNSFTDAFQQPSLGLEENIAFKPKLQSKDTSKNFDAERNILRQDRHKLMEKFNILNTNVAPKVTPQIKILQKEKKSHKFIDADVNKVCFTEKIDDLVLIYDALLKNNLILSVNTEIYYLITILLSKQEEDDFRKVDKSIQNIMKTIHNSTCFSVKSLWNLRLVLEIILDKNALKTLGENKKIRSFFPDLAKFLLNAYGLKCEMESQRKMILENRISNGIVCFNLDTDNADNFPSLLSFQNFKKQRDMFYEILRWYQDTQNNSRSSLRVRIKSLLSCGPSAANHAHLAKLFVHLLAECLPPNEQESKLSKLQRRLTCPNAPESHRLPHFTEKEMFYKDFIMYAENECFRVHLKDALVFEIISLDSKYIKNDTSNGADNTREFLLVSKKLGLLAKFLGYLTSLPYALDMTGKTVPTIETYTTPKEKVLENNLALRNYSQPNIDLIGILTTTLENNKLCITLPWLIHYLSMLDYTTLRTTYYKNLLKTIFCIYENTKNLKKFTKIFLKSIMGWLFDLPHFPRELFSECTSEFKSITIDEELIDESVLFELCPFLKDINVLLTNKVTEKDMGTFRHITPVSLCVNVEDRMRNKERELQTRLEEEFLKSQPSSTRRVLELVIERVTSSAVKELTANCLNDARKRCTEMAFKLVSSSKDKDKPTLLQGLNQLYTEQLEHLRTTSLEQARTHMRARVSSALSALLPSAVAQLHAPLVAFACKACNAKLVKWTNEHWNSTAVLCKNINEELNTLIMLGDNFQNQLNDKPITMEFTTFDSPAFAIISLKEQICLLLDYEDGDDIYPILDLCARCTIKNPYCRPPAQKAILQLSVDYCIVFVSRKPEQLNEKLLLSLHKIWNNCCPDRKPSSPQELTVPERRASISPTFTDFREERAPTPISDEEGPIGKVIYDEKEKNGNVVINDSKVESPNTESDPNLEYFDRILCPRNIVLMSESNRKSSDIWQALADVLVFMLKQAYLSEDSLTEQCLAVYRQDWPQNILENLSTCMKCVSSKWSRSSTGKFTLFLDFLADFCGNMDFEPLE